MTDTWSYGDHRIESVYQRISPPLQAEIIEFWKRNHALAAGVDPQQRVREVVIVAFNASGTVVGVNTVFRGQLRAEGPPLFIYRQFIQSPDRVSGMVRFMLIKAWQALHDVSMPDKPVGVVFVSENQKLMRPGVVALLGRLGWQKIGKTAKQQDIWRKDF